MKHEILSYLKDRILILDGGAGSVLQEQGLKPGVLPETLNIDDPELITGLHQAYLYAGSHVVLTNTFGANSLKFSSEGEYSLERIVKAGIDCAREAVRRIEAGEPLQERYAAYLKGCPHLKGTPARDRKHFVALDIGPTGHLLKPLGDLDFEDAVNVFKKTISAGASCGADLIYIETMNDSYEAKAALLAAKEVCDLPVFVTTVFDEKARLLTGADPGAAVAMLEGLGADAIGMNCSLGPAQMKNIVPEYASYSSIPVIVKPNAGLPHSEGGRTVYDVGPEEFAEHLRGIIEAGANIVGGCCGTNPAFIRLLANVASEMPQHLPEDKGYSVISSYTHAVYFDKKPVLIGERINPTGKKKFKEALRNHDIDYIIGEGLKQEAAGTDALDVNVGLPEIDEPSLMEEVVCELQSVLSLPLQIDTTNPEAMERALRRYNGKALINSVNGREDVMKTVFPLAKKYGGVIVSLTIDESGIPDTAQGRIDIVNKIVRTAESYGIAKKNLIIDPLAMAVSSDDYAAKVTLDTLRRIHDELGMKTILGVSNVSFGLPAREIATSIFFTMAMQSGLSAAIMNPMSVEMKKAYHSFVMLSGLDKQCTGYIEFATNIPAPTAAAAPAASTAPAPEDGAGDDELAKAVTKGLKTKAEELARLKLSDTDPLDIINKSLIPGLDTAGKGFEKKTMFLPQLLMSAEAAKAAFAVIKEFMDAKGLGDAKKGPIVLATVKGDIHDIGKNIVKVLLENYGYEVIDLGRDVPPEVIVETVVEKNIKLVGLSALMTTTVPSMDETIKLLRPVAPDCKVCVGGAVLTPEYAQMVGADRYCKDAMETVDYAKEIFG
ncbi:MAG: homocysteine S-methyltransferase family protein [Lachnospiraceae bacterium]|nr:homocysteine S-methyltransferase family protein [Lachnospiraceae bacterium]